MMRLGDIWIKSADDVCDSCRVPVVNCMKLQEVRQNGLLNPLDMLINITECEYYEEGLP